MTEQTKAKYYVTLGHINPTFHPVEGEPVVIPGFEALHLFVHRSVVHNMDRMWQVTEATTGLAFGNVASNKELAVEAMGHRLRQTGLPKMLEVIDSVKEKTPWKP